MPPLCSRRCFGCNEYKPLNHFYDRFGFTEFQYCTVCRMSGKGVYSPKGSEYQWYRDKGIYFNSPEAMVAEVLPLPSEPTYHDIEVVEVNCRDSLIYGEKYITHDNLVRDVARNRSKVTNTRKSERRFADVPWHYATWASSHYELGRRHYYENLWKAGLDDCVPQMLLDKKQWDDFWKFFKHTATAKESLAEEGGEGNPWSKGLVGKH